MNGFKIISKIGEGAYSTVHKVKRYEDENIYALKKVKLLKLSKKEKENALNEVRILASVKSNFVISYKEAFFDEKDSTLGIVMEFADRGDLFQRIAEYRKRSILFNENDIWRIFIQLVKGLKALHDLNILHRDLKSANVFLFSDGGVKLGDLNVSKVAKKGLGYTQTGTPYYASPEVWDDRPYNCKSDIWSLGIVLYEMIMLRPPFRAENMEGLYNKVMKGIYPHINERYSSDLSEILRILIQVDPAKRPTCDQILNLNIVKKRIEYFKTFNGTDEKEEEEKNLLRTINIPKNLVFLSDKLPQPNYDDGNNKKKCSSQRYGVESVGDDGENNAADDNCLNSANEGGNANNKALPDIKFKIMSPRVNSNGENDITSIKKPDGGINNENQKEQKSISSTNINNNINQKNNQDIKESTNEKRITNNDVSNTNNNYTGCTVKSNSSKDKEKEDSINSKIQSRNSHISNLNKFNQLISYETPTNKEENNIKYILKNNSISICNNINNSNSNNININLNNNLKIIQPSYIIKNKPDPLQKLIQLPELKKSIDLPSINLNREQRRIHNSIGHYNSKLIRDLKNYDNNREKNLLKIYGKNSLIYKNNQHKYYSNSSINGYQNLINNYSVNNNSNVGSNYYLKSIENRPMQLMQKKIPPSNILNLYKVNLNLN